MAVFGMFGIVGLRVGLVSGVTLDHHYNDSLPVILSPVLYPLQNGQFFLSIIHLFLSQFQVRVFYMKVKHIVTARSFKWLTAYKKIGPRVTSLTRAAVPSSMNMLKVACEFADVTTGFSLKWFTNIVRSIKWKLVLQKFKPFLWNSKVTPLNDLYFSCLKILLLCPSFDFCLLDLLCLFVWGQSNSVLNLNIFHSWNHCKKVSKYCIKMWPFHKQNWFPQS